MLTEVNKLFPPALVHIYHGFRYLCKPALVHIYLVEEHRLSIKGVNGFADDSWSERPPMLRPSVRWEKDRSLKL